MLFNLYQKPIRLAFLIFTSDDPEAQSFKQLSQDQNTNLESDGAKILTVVFLPPKSTDNPLHTRVLMMNE